jgi:hypothetical protein
MRGQSDAAELQKGTEMPADSARPSEWWKLWPAYCIGIGIVLILVGALV